MPLTRADLEAFFTYHSPRADQLENYVAVRKAGHALALAIFENCPECPDTTAAIRKVREATMTANAAIAIYKPIPGDTGQTQAK